MRVQTSPSGHMNLTRLSPPPGVASHLPVSRSAGSQCSGLELFLRARLHLAGRLRQGSRGRATVGWGARLGAWGQLEEGALSFA